MLLIFEWEKFPGYNNTIMWKQSTDIKINDIVYIYVGKPYSSIMYKFKVAEVKIEDSENRDIDTKEEFERELSR